MLKKVKRPWTVLVYIAGDNNLSDAGLEDIREMCDTGASESCHVGVEIDTYGEYEGSIRYEITEKDWTDSAHRVVIERLPEGDSGDPETLMKFLKWGTDRYESEKTIVVVWNHGAGFRAPKRDIAYDDYGSSIDMPEMVTAFSAAEFGPENKISVLGFDACLMSMLEIANHLSDHVQFLVGSQETEPGDGWPYDKVLEKVKEDPSARELAVQIVDVYLRSYEDIGIGSVTQSAIDTGATGKVAEALHALGEELVARASSTLPLMRRVRLEVQAYHMADYVDLISLSESVARHCSDESIVAAANRVAKSVRGAVVHTGYFGDQVAGSHGLSVWFPHISHIYLANRTKYLALRCNRPDAGWVRFLDLFHTQ